MTAMAPRSNREKLFSADQPSRIASSALAAPALPGRYLLNGLTGTDSTWLLDHPKRA